MSLKKFHILFITLATLCFLGFGAWCFVQQEDGGVLVITFAIMSVLLGLLTAFYGVWFYRNKIKPSERDASASI